MILRIAKKEVLSGLMSLRFLLSVILVVSLFATSGFVFVNSHGQQVRDYRQRTDKNLSEFQEQTNRLYDVALHTQELWRGPSPLAFCAEGSEESLPNYFRMSAFGMQAPEAKSKSNFMLPPFNDLDWAFLIGTVLSFIALVLAYDCVSGERESGTLRLALSGPIPRDTVLAGKYLGTMVMLGIPLLLGVLVNLIIVMSYGIVALTGGDWLKIVAFVFLSFAYLSVFVLLGLLVSSRARHSVSAIVVLLLVWVGLVILVPSSGWIAARWLGKAMTVAEKEEKRREVSRELWENIRAKKYGQGVLAMFPDRDDPRNNPPARAKYRDASTQATNQLNDAYFVQASAQGALGRQVTRLSPAVLYQCVAEALGGTGIQRTVHLYGQVKEYQAALKEYIRGKDAEDPESLHLLCEDRAMAERWQSISHQTADFDGVPKFNERRMTLGESLKSSIWDVGLLVLMNVVLFTAAHVSLFEVRRALTVKPCHLWHGRGASVSAEA